MIRRGLLAVVALVWLFPYLWMGLTSLKPLDEIIHAPTALLPHHATLDAYREVFHTLPLPRYFLNTSVMALSIAALQIAIALP
ncbi:MAG TPA: carbohydrate ABC transporter permease, partial [Polyangiaceae bacterium]